MVVVLITGGAGFIGSHIAERLAAEGFDVSVLDDLSTGKKSNLANAGSRVHFFKGSFTDPSTVQPLLKDCETVLHHGAFLGVRRVAEDPWRVFETNGQGDHVLFDLIRKSSVRKVIFASSSEVYGKTNKLPLCEEDGLHLETPYQCTKKVSESYCNVLFEKYGIDSCSLRYFNIYGPKQEGSEYGFVVSIFSKNALSGKPLIIFGDGAQTRDFTYVSDAVNANVLAMKKKTGGEIINIGTGIETKINDLAHEIVKASNSKSKIIHGAAIQGEIKRRVARIDKAKTLLGYSPKINLEDGLKKTLVVAEQ